MGEFNSNTCLSTTTYLRQEEFPRFVNLVIELPARYILLLRLEPEVFSVRNIYLKLYKDNMGHRHSVYQYSPDEDLCVDCQRLFGSNVLTRKERVKAKFHMVDPVPLLQAILEDMTKLWGGISQPVRRLQDFASFASVLTLFEKVEEGMSELVPKINSWLRVHPNAPMHIQDLLLDIMVNYCFLHQQMFQLAQIQLKRYFFFPSISHCQ